MRIRPLQAGLHLNPLPDFPRLTQLEEPIMPIASRVLLGLLVVGVWFLVLRPQGTDAHDDQRHICSVSGVAFGEVEKVPRFSRGAQTLTVYVYDVDSIRVECHHA